MVSAYPDRYPCLPELGFLSRRHLLRRLPELLQGGRLMPGRRVKGAAQYRDCHGIVGESTRSDMTEPDNPFLAGGEAGLLTTVPISPEGGYSAS